ncbi:MAG TPA: hypothetical protein EYN91_08975 [Candidatus Melainabacteria bacterium]|nr:hypothetical protein [Candidatus Melainabacteria bacterium]
MTPSPTDCPNHEQLNFNLETEESEEEQQVSDDESQTLEDSEDESTQEQEDESEDLTDDLQEQDAF